MPNNAPLTVFILQPIDLKRIVFILNILHK